MVFQNLNDSPTATAEEIIKPVSKFQSQKTWISTKRQDIPLKFRVCVFEKHINSAVMKLCNYFPKHHFASRIFTNSCRLCEITRIEIFGKKIELPFRYSFNFESPLRGSFHYDSIRLFIYSQNLPFFSLANASLSKKGSICHVIFGQNKIIFSLILFGNYKRWK